MHPTYLINEERRYWITPNSIEHRLFMKLRPIHFDDHRAWITLLGKRIVVGRRVRD